MSDDTTVPTEGVDRGHTMVVWPARPKWGQPGAGTSIGINPDFDPTTGNGWLPEEDGYSEALPTGVPANIRLPATSFEKVQSNCPTNGDQSAFS